MVIEECKRCGAMIPEERRALAPNVVYCSRHCATLAARKRDKSRSRAAVKEIMAKERLRLVEGLACKGCGGAISPLRVFNLSKAPMYCSKECSKKTNRKIKEPLQITCAHCKKTRPSVRKRKYCSAECRSQATYERVYSDIRKRNAEKRKYNPGYSGEITSAARGMAAQRRVEADLLEKGYELYVAVTANAPFDLIAYRNGEMLRVEARYSRGGKVNRNVTRGKTDLYAFVSPEGVRYEKELKEIEEATYAEQVESQQSL